MSKYRAKVVTASLDISDKTSRHIKDKWMFKSSGNDTRFIIKLLYESSYFRPFYFQFKIVGDLQHDILHEESARKHSLVTILVTK